MSGIRLHEPEDRKFSGKSEGQSRGTPLVTSDGPPSSGASSTAAFADLNLSRHRDNGVQSSKAPSFFNRNFSNPFQRTKAKEGVHDEEDNKENDQHRVGLRLLHSSPEPLIDLIFVHGLKGHPVKTWRESGKPQSLWPQYWLPLDPGFHHVNVHSFGYEAEVARGSSILEISDFGETLLEEMRNSPYLRDNENGPIILLGHSLGGLVIKKAFVLAEEVASLRGRIRTVFFLGTPHGGSNLAKTLKNVFTAVGSSRSYLNDLSTGSSALQLISEEFERRAQEMPIFSFFETAEMRLGGIMSQIVVPKDSAILGPRFPNERVQYLNADHRGLVKFPHPNDDNYLKLKNALSGAVHDLLKDVAFLKQQEAKEQIRLLATWLSIPDRANEEQHKVEGSCQWIDDREEFQEWKSSASTYGNSEEQQELRKPSIIWVHANPGTGKSVLAQHVLSGLQELKAECSYYYFHIGNKTSGSLGEFLRSMAFQMAMANASARRALVQLCQEGSVFNFDDNRAIWTRVFSKGIFQTGIVATQFWVIDALDECGKYQELFTLLRGEQPTFPLRIFMTSRNVPDLRSLHQSLEPAATVYTIDIPISATMHDIECFVRSRIGHLPLDIETEREELATTLLQRSDACFLWVRLVMDKLETVYSSESIMQILREMPEGMVPYYERATREMSESIMEKDIAAAVLLWVAVGSRTMTTTELASALKLDIKKTLTSSKAAIEGLCGQLVCVDSNTEIVSLVHPTAREFLLTETTHEFHIIKAAAHERIAMACFEALQRPEMRPPRSRRTASARKMVDNPLLSYAVTQLSEHIYGSSAMSDRILISMERFFKTNVLSWIERVARIGNLQLLIRATRNLKAYLERRARYKSPLGKTFQNIDHWSTDLTRLVTKFGDALLKDPISIHFLVPPLCPTSSSIYSQFGRTKPDGIVLAGFKSETWDDCIASITFGEDDPIAVSCGETTIAVSLASGGISLYHQQSCQKVGFLKSRWPIDLVRFADDRVVVATIKTVLVMDLEGNTMWEKRIRSRFLFLTIYGNSVYAVAQSGHLRVFNMVDGTEERNENFEYNDHVVESDIKRVTDRAPAVASISPDMETLAMGFMGGTACLWDLPSSEFVGWARDEDDWGIAQMIFNPNPSIKLLFIVYINHRISVFDTTYGCLVETRDPPTVTGVMSAACSHDGRTAVTMNMQGALQIWDFESLALLYHLDTPTSPQRILDFSPSGTSIIDVSTTGMRIWSPAALIRKNVEDDESISDYESQPDAQPVQYAPMGSTRITALCAHPSLPIVFAGTSKGSVFAFSAKTGKELSLLYDHPYGDRITCIAVGKNGSIASSDDGTNIMAWKLEFGPGGIPNLTSQLLRDKRSAARFQLHFSASGDYLLISDSVADTVYYMNGPNATLVGATSFYAQEQGAREWFATSYGSNNESNFALVANRMFMRFSASKFPETVDSATRLDYELKEGDEERGIAKFELDTVTQTLILAINQWSGHNSCVVTLLFDLKQSIPTTCKRYDNTLAPSYRFSSDFCGSFIGLSKKTKNFIFLEGSSWLSTLELGTFVEKASYLQHFFVPNEYLPPRAGEDGVRPVTTAADDIVFCLYGELVVIKNGLNFEEEKALDLKKYIVGRTEETTTQS